MVQDSPDYGEEIPPEVFDIAVRIMRFIAEIDADCPESVWRGEKDE